MSSSSQRLHELLAQVPVALGAFQQATDDADKDVKLVEAMKQVQELIQEVKTSCAVEPKVDAPLAPEVAPVAPTAPPSEPEKVGWLSSLFGTKAPAPAPAPVVAPEAPKVGGSKKRRSQVKGGTLPMDMGPIYNVTGLITDATNPLALDTAAYNNLANVPPPVSTGFDQSLYAATKGLNDTIVDKIMPPIADKIMPQTGGKKPSKKKHSPKRA